jgi:fumarate reductase subunit C
MTTGQTSRVLAWLDLLQGLSGLLLVAFMWAHMLFVSSILLGMDAMYTVARLFEGEFIFGRPYPQLVSFVVLVIFLLFSLHAILSLRKIPSSYSQYRSFRQHMGVFRHTDTSLWLVQVITGLILLLLAFAHLYQMFIHPADIGPYASADRIWSGRLWPFYLLLLVCVEIHGGIGLYRLALKWGWVQTTGGQLARKKLQRVKWSVTAFFLVLGLLTLAAYMKVGFEHRDHVGERYLPAQAVEN